MKIIRKLLRFFYRDPSAGHVTSFSRWLACWSVRVVALFYGRESTELVSIWYVFQFYLALYLHVLYFYFSFHRSSWKKICAYPQHQGKVLLELHVFKCDRWMLRRDWTLASTVVVDSPIIRFSYLWFQLRAIFLYLHSTKVFSQPLSASREGDGYHFRPSPPPTTRVEFLESDLKRDSRDQRSAAMQWSNISKEITVY